MVFLQLISYLSSYLYADILFGISDWWWPSYREIIVFDMVLLIGISAYLLVVRMRMREEGEVVGDGQWRLLAVIAFTYASFYFLPMVLHVVSYELSTLVPMGQFVWTMVAFEQGTVLVIIHLVVGFGMYLGIALKAYGRISIRLTGDPFALENRRFLALISILGVRLGARFINGLGWFSVFYYEPWNAMYWTYDLFMFNPIWFLYSTLMLVAILPTYLYFRRRMRVKGEVMDREQWQELAFMAIGLFVVNLPSLYYSLDFLLGLLLDPTELDRSFHLLVLSSQLSAAFNSLALLSIGLYSRKRSKEERPIDVSPLAVPG